MIQPNSRLAGLLDDPQPEPERSEAQRQASRRNGRLSRGPKTPAGKARSSQNARKHGLLARVAAPRPGTEEATRYREALDELTQEHSPATFAERSLVAGLAHDYVRYGLALEMLNHSFPTPLPSSSVPGRRGEDPETTLGEFEELRERAALLERAVEPLDSREPLNFLDGEAEKLAEAVIGITDWVQYEMAQIEEEEAEGEDEHELDDEQEEIAYRRELYAVLQRARRKLTDADHLAAVFRGDRSVPPAQLKKIRRFLGEALEQTRTNLAIRGDVSRMAARHRSGGIAQLTAMPDNLIRLETYLRRIEYAIERKQDQLIRMQG